MIIYKLSSPLRLKKCGMLKKRTLVVGRSVVYPFNIKIHCKFKGLKERVWEIDKACKSDCIPRKEKGRRSHVAPTEKSLWFIIILANVNLFHLKMGRISPWDLGWKVLFTHHCDGLVSYTITFGPFEYSQKCAIPRVISLNLMAARRQGVVFSRWTTKDSGPVVGVEAITGLNGESFAKIFSKRLKPNRWVIRINVCHVRKRERTCSVLSKCPTRPLASSCSLLTRSSMLPCTGNLFSYINAVKHKVRWIVIYSV